MLKCPFIIFSYMNTMLGRESVEVEIEILQKQVKINVRDIKLCVAILKAVCF